MHMQTQDLSSADTVIASVNVSLSLQSDILLSSCNAGTLKTPCSNKH